MYIQVYCVIILFATTGVYQEIYQLLIKVQLRTDWILLRKIVPKSVK